MYIRTLLAEGGSLKSLVWGAPHTVLQEEIPTFLSNIVNKTVIYGRFKPISDFPAHLVLYLYWKHDFRLLQYLWP